MMYALASSAAIQVSQDIGLYTAKGELYYGKLLDDSKLSNPTYAEALSKSIKSKMLLNGKKDEDDKKKVRFRESHNSER